MVIRLLRAKMTYHIILRYLFIDVLRIVPFVLHHEPSNERGLELPACVQCLDEDFQAVCLSKYTSFLYHRSVYDSLSFVDCLIIHPYFCSV